MSKLLNIALPKGRLGEKVYKILSQAGFSANEILGNSRKLIFENKDTGVRFFWAKPADVAVYVERGVADVGVAGKDILMEYDPEVLELVDLGIGKCKMCVAAKKGYKDNSNKVLRVATKFNNCAWNYYSNRRRDIDIIHLNGSVEIAPIIGLSDVIVDIVETGETLKENGLEIIDEIFPISAMVIANQSSYLFKYDVIERVKDGVIALGLKND